MNAVQREFRADERVSLEKTLHDILAEVASARVAAMQILIFHMQVDHDQGQHIDPEEFMTAVKSVKDAHDVLRSMKTTHLETAGVSFPEKLEQHSKKVTHDVSELVNILDRCSHSSEDGIRGFKPSKDMYDLCCVRIAKGLNTLGTEMAAYFLELMEKDKADVSDKTSSIALEIGKIGRVINMVATNASIEAARAGDAGKGFTVIADEVKTLSSRVSSLSVSLTNRLQ